jgi:hypothetical protein
MILSRAGFGLAIVYHQVIQNNVSITSSDLTSFMDLDVTRCDFRGGNGPGKQGQRHLWLQRTHPYG